MREPAGHTRTCRESGNASRKLLCACVCVCVRARARACVRACVRLRCPEPASTCMLQPLAAAAMRCASQLPDEGCTALTPFEVLRRTGGGTHAFAWELRTSNKRCEKATVLIIFGFALATVIACCACAVARVHPTTTPKTGCAQLWREHLAAGAIVASAPRGPPIAICTLNYPQLLIIRRAIVRQGYIHAAALTANHAAACLHTCVSRPET